MSCFVPLNGTAYWDTILQNFPAELVTAIKDKDSEKYRKELMEQIKAGIGN